MFGVRNRNKQQREVISNLIALPDDQFVLMVASMLAEEIPNFWLQSAVAYQNLLPVFPAAIRSSKTDQPKDAGDLVDNLICDTGPGSPKMPRHELARRRVYWNWMGLLILRATERSMARGSDSIDRSSLGGRWLNKLGPIKPECEKAVTDIWIYLTQGCELLPGAIEKNVLWDDDEKRWFSSISSSADGITYCLNILMPSPVRNTPEIKKFAADHNLELFADHYLPM